MAEKYVASGPAVNDEPVILTVPDGADFESLHTRLEVVEGQAPGATAWGGVTGTLADQTDLQTALDAKSGTGHTHPGVYEPANANIQSHVGSAHAPSNAQANADITKAEIEAKLTGVISSHSHAGGGADADVSLYK